MNIAKKYICVIVFTSIIGLGLLISIIKKDEMFSDIENKVLAQKPILNSQSLMDGSYMDNFDKYATDQFPQRVNFIKMKNDIMHLLGQREFRGIYYKSGERLLEKFVYNNELVSKNIEYMNTISNYFKLESTGMFIPTSIAIYKDVIPPYYISSDQDKVLKDIKNEFSGEFYTPYSVLLKNRDKEIYFKTDHHWTQYGAKLMYEDYYDKKVNFNYKKVTSDFKGTYYSKVLSSGIESDDIYAYEDLKWNNIQYDGKESKSLYDEEKLNGKNKYQYFLNGDPAMALIQGKGKGEVLIFKDSFAHCYIPFLTREYSKIHVIDPRYSNINIVDYVSENKNIEKIYYIYSLSSLNSNNIFEKYKNMLK